MRQVSLKVSSAAMFLCLLSVLAIAGDTTNKRTTDVTYTRDVAPILQKNCMTCHRAGEIAPMSFASYGEVRPWAKAIRENILSRRMPPWHADDSSRPCENDPRLSKKEIDAIVAWIDGGAKQGDPRDLPPNPSFPEGWSIGKPDLVFSMQHEFTVPAEGVVPYKYFMVPTNFKEDAWVTAAEIRPGNRSVVHHVIVFVREPGGDKLRDPQTGQEARDGFSERPEDRTPEAITARNQERQRQGRLDAMLVGTAPGMPPFAFKPGQAKLIKAGSILVFQMHYTPNGSEEKDRSSVGMIFAKGPVERSVMTFGIAQTNFKIPPRDPNYEVRSSFTFPQDSRVLSVMPHMHVRGKDFKYTAVHPDGRQELILSVPRWDFNWQQIYRFKEPVFMPKGSRIDCVAHFDNSPGNKFNPDPTKEVYWGDQTWEEMMIGWMDFVFDKPVTTSSTQGSPR